MRLLLWIALLAAGCSNKPSLPSYGVVPDFSLTDQTGAAFDSKARLDGKVWVANFIFTTCTGPCPRMSSQIGQLRDALPGRDDIRFVSFTVDPARDTPPVLAEYAKRYKADERWWFLTGPQDKLHELKRYVFMLGDVDGSLQHSTRFVLVDEKGRVRGFYDTSEQQNIDKLIADIKDVAGERA